MEKLYIIGNGFDRWHDLPTGYDRFYAFAKEMLDEFQQYYLFDAPPTEQWCDFENNLGCFDWFRFYKAHNHIDVAAENFRPSEVYGLEDDLTAQVDHHVEAIKESFREWVEGIDISVAEKKLSFPREARFITFNYTSTLQTIYGISDDRVFHLHGRAGFDDLIFGHGEIIEEKPEVDEDGNSNRTMFSDAEDAAKYPFYALRKPVKEALEKNIKIFDSVAHVSEIVVIGHSLNKVDLPYFNKLAASSPSARWLVSYYENQDEVDHIEKLVKCGVRRENIQACTYDEVRDSHRHDRT